MTKTNKKHRSTEAAPQIKVVYTAIDGAKKTSTFTRLSPAQKFAQQWVGAHPEIGSHYAVSSDGVGKIEVTGAASLKDLFPPSAVEEAALVSVPEALAVTEMTPEQLVSSVAAAMDEIEASVEDKPEPRSVVDSKFKRRYTANARDNGIKGKAARRSNWDWLSQQIAQRCLNKKAQIDMGGFLKILEANGVDHTKWPNRERGWEGRLRMTGRVALQRIIADAGVLKLPDEDPIAVPGDFVSKYKTKE